MVAKFSELHGPGGNGAYYNERPMLSPELECKCGHVATGRTWEEVGRDFDQHLSDARREAQDAADEIQAAIHQ